MRGRTKVMIGRDGSAKVQYEEGDTVRVYSLPEWNAFRDAKQSEATDAPLPEVELEDKQEDAGTENPLIQDDNDDDDAEATLTSNGSDELGQSPDSGDDLGPGVSAPADNDDDDGNQEEN